MFWFIAQSLFVILLAFGLGVLVGRIWLRPQGDRYAVDPWLVDTGPAVAAKPAAVPSAVADVPEAARTANGWPAGGRRDSGTAGDDADPAASAATPAATPTDVGPPAPRHSPGTAVPAQLDLPDAGPEPDEASAEQVERVEQTPARSAASARPAWPSDRLEQIEGIGPKIADALRAAGVTVDYREFGSLIHGFANFFALGGGSATAVAESISALRAHLART